jgi:hypothetical protein
MNRHTTNCKKCGIKISLSNISKHEKSCGTKKIRLKSINYLQNDGTYKCPYCGKVYSKLGIISHIWRNHEDGINWKNNNLGGKPSWNHGLTKETDARVKKGSDTFNTNLKSGAFIPFFKGKHLSIDHRNTIANTIKENVKNDNWHLSFSKSRTHEYAGKKFQGIWEVEYAKWLDANSIKWRRPTEKFEYFFDGKKRYYTPDFYLLEDNVYIEIKGYPTDKDFAKWDQFPMNIRILNGYDLHSQGIISSYRRVNREYKGKSWNL